ncbi:hypothetical protein B0A48_16617 [Cryoendolithus antarcticus]|uniref:Major facilitator superfamily (MFS) profile domain-containing protein n=1 Tax=Cryoendolithus antarcticus TaxID=1507870 RepID=A0A1V8SE78_9PEZI|nr:hypothetical protein B0A48_16617 [Cryoendolithus antarcticus]
MVKQYGNIYLIAGISVIGGALFGFDISSMSAIIAGKGYLCYFNQGDEPCLGPRSEVQGGITASMAGGSWLASLCSGFLADRIGRKKAIMTAAVIWVIGSIIVSASQNIAMLIVGRVINGFSVGIASAQVPVYITELAPPAKRGRLVGMQQWAITWGILIMFFISYGCSFLNGPTAFRVPWALQMIPAIILFFGMMILPESPRWLATKNRWEECEQVLVLTLGKGESNSPLVADELKDIKEWLEIELPALLFVDKIGRRPTLLFGSTFMMIWLFANAGLLATYGTDPGPNGVGGIKEASVEVSGAASKAVIACSYLFVASFAPTWGPVSWIYPPELYPNKIRSKAVALATSGNWAFNFALGYFVPIAFVTIKWKTYVIFGVFCLAMTIHVFFLFVSSASDRDEINPADNSSQPETAGKRLEDVTAMFEDPHGIKYIGTPAWKTRSATSRASRLEHEEGGMHSSDEDSSPERKEKYDENEKKENV